MFATIKHAGGIALAISLFAAPALAQGMGTGPVGQSCQPEIKKYCAGLKHGQGQVRDCLEKNKDKVSEACRHALDTTGFGRKMRQQQ